MVEKKLRFWYEKDEKKRKRTPKVSPKVVTPKVVIKGKVAKQESQKRLVDYSFECYTNIVDVCIAEPTKKKSPPKLVDEPMVSTIDLIQEGVDLMKMTLDDFVKQSEAAKAVKDTEKEAKTFSKNVEAEGVKETLVEGVVQSDSSATESDEFDPTKIALTSYISGSKILKVLQRKRRILTKKTLLIFQHLESVKLIHQEWFLEVLERDHLQLLR
ncbi:hypothetical protein HanRHA438_Chr12g0569731 [Helianthus annuus]|nr:hypothetical protein HanPI659440_Chr12g0474861 [Helianthus annuus]KAJ0868008.1 hypothetical protein HanRHA438_Chr12g0569731 [Helianthus annuus]